MSVRCSHVAPCAPVTQRVRWLLYLAPLPVACVVLALVDPSRGQVLPPCPFRALTGYVCPGCGTTRAVHALLRGEVAGAFAYNPLAVLVVPALLYALVSACVFVARGRWLPRPVPPAWAIRGFAVAVMAFGILRNVPALHWLSPAV